MSTEEVNKEIEFMEIDDGNVSNPTIPYQYHTNTIPIPYQYPSDSGTQDIFSILVQRDDENKPMKVEEKPNISNCDDTPWNMEMFQIDDGNVSNPTIPHQLQTREAKRRKSRKEDDIKQYNKNIYKCKYCNKALARPQTLRDHILKFHPDASTMELEKEKPNISISLPSQTGSAMEHKQSQAQKYMGITAMPRAKDKNKDKGKGKGKKSVLVMSPSHSGPALTNQQSSNCDDTPWNMEMFQKDDGNVSNPTIPHQMQTREAIYLDLDLDSEQSEGWFEERSKLEDMQAIQGSAFNIGQDSGQVRMRTINQDTVLPRQIDDGNVSNPTIPHQTQTREAKKYDKSKATKPKAILFPNTKAENLPEVSKFSGRENKKSFKKVYQCAIDADFPDNEGDKKYLKERVTKLILASTQSSIDLDFVKKLILFEHTHEIASLEFEEMNFKQLPWSSLVFDILDIKEGSTIIKFHLGFQEPPQNESDLNIYRLIELVVITIIENLQFIKSIKEFKTDRKEDSLVLSATVEAILFDESVIKQTISSLRGSLSFIVSETDTADDQVETFLLDLFEQKPDEFLKLTNLNLTPVSMRRIIAVLKDSKLTEKDVANVTIELDTTTKKNKCALVKSDSSFLFPYNFRKLADLEPQVFKLMLKTTRDLPKEKELWYKFFVYNLDIFEVEDIIKLSKEVDADWPYPNILHKYKEHGGTLGGLVQALEKFKEEVEGGKEKQNIAMFLETIKNLREETYESLIERVFCPSQCPTVQNIEDFQKMARERGLKIKTNPMQSFKTLQSSLIPGDQLWIFHERPQMRTYAHVAIITEALKFIHATAPKRFHLKLIFKSKIKEENQYKLLDEKFCFVVRPAVPIERDPDIFSKRAFCCCGILFDYDPKTANCETFCNGVHGIWKPSVQGQDLRGIAQNAANALSKLVIKHRNEALTSQMQKRFQEQQMILPNEIFQ